MPKQSAAECKRKFRAVQQEKQEEQQNAHGNDNAEVAHAPQPTQQSKRLLEQKSDKKQKVEELAARK